MWYSSVWGVPARFEGRGLGIDIFRRVFPSFGALGAVAFVLGAYGYDYGTNVHHDQILPFIFRLIDPTVFPGDPYLDTLRLYPSFFPHLVAGIAKLYPHVSAIMGFLHLLTIFFAVLGLAALADALFHNVRVKVLAVVLVLCSQFLNAHSFFGEDAIFRNHLDQTTLSWAFLLWALSFWFRGRPALTCLLLGLAANINPLSALHVGAALGLSLGFSKGGTGPTGKVLLTSAAIGLAAASPVIIKIFTQPSGTPADPILFLETLKAWYPFHYFPEQWPPGKWLAAFSYTGLYGLLLYLSPRDLRERVQPLMAAALALILMGFVAWAVGSPTLIRLQFFRVDAVLILLGILLTAHAAESFLREATLHRLLLGTLLIATVTVWFSWMLALLTAVVLAVDRFSERRWAWWAGAALFLGAAVLSLRLASQGGGALFASDVIMIILIVGALMFLPPRPLPQVLRRPLLLFLLALVFSPFGMLIQIHLAGRTLSNHTIARRQFEREWRGIQLWSYRNTPPDSLFIVPPELGSFRNFSGRSVVFQWIDGSAMHWAPGYSAKWVERLKDFKGNLPAMLDYWAIVPAMLEYWPIAGEERQTSLLARSHQQVQSPLETIFYTLTEDDFIRLRDKYDADYLLTRVGAPPLSFPVVLQGQFLRLHLLRKGGYP